MRSGDFLHMKSHVREILLHKRFGILWEVSSWKTVGLCKKGMGGNLTQCSYVLLKNVIRYSFKLSHFLGFFNSKEIWTDRPREIVSQVVSGIGMPGVKSWLSP